MLLSAIVAGIINKYLGKYIINLDTKNVDISIFKGDLELRDLQLKPEALTQLNLPIEVKAGYIGQIKLEIPWLSLWSTSIIATVEDVYVLAGPVTDRPYDEEREKRLERAKKASRLEALAGAPSDDENKEYDPGFVERLSTYILNNLQVIIANIHIRYEDTVTNPDHAFACGVMLKELSLFSTNASWQEAKQESSAILYHKMIRLDGFSGYWNPYLSEQNLVRSRLYTDGWRNLLKKGIATHRIFEEDLDFMIEPILAEAKLIFNKDPTFKLPKIFADFTFQDLEVLLSRQQFLNILSLQESFSMMALNTRYRKYRPNIPLKMSPSAWWRYAYTAIVENFIRPYTWSHIKAHRLKYNAYKNAFKKWLEHKDSDSKEKLEMLEAHLDVPNILLAREHAKVEYAHETPERVKRKEKKKGWWSWLTGDSSDEEDDVEEKREKGWLAQLDPDEKKKLYEDIGYTSSSPSSKIPAEYVAYKVQVTLTSCCLSLVNYSKKILQMSVTHFLTTYEDRPASSGFRVSTNTEGFALEGTSVEHELIPIVTSAVGVYVPSENHVLVADFEQNPTYVEADYSLKLNVQPVEVVYDEHSLSEVLAFFQLPNRSIDMKSVAKGRLQDVVQYSRAGIQYAIEKHKTFNVAIHLRSPYVVIPEHGTLHRGGNVLVIDFGTLRVTSELQPKDVSLEDATMSELESRLYDQFNIKITDVKVLLADSGDDWHAVQTQPDSEFHIVPSVGMSLTFFNAVKQDFTELPRQKLVANLPTLKLNVSNKKLLTLGQFSRNFPIPSTHSMACMASVTEDTSDSPLSKPAISDFNPTTSQVEPSIDALKLLKKRVRRKLSRIIRAPLKPVPDSVDTLSNKTGGTPSLLYSTSEQSDEDLPEWASNLDVKPVDDHSSRTNTSKMMFRFVVGEIVVHLARTTTLRDAPYMMFRLDRVRVDSSLTVYGFVATVSLGGLQLVDKVHTGPSGEYLELISSKSDTEWISVTYRKVDPSCPDFDSIYKRVTQGILIQFQSLIITFDRDSILFLINYIQSIKNRMENATMSASVSTVKSEPLTTAFALPSFNLPGFDEVDAGPSTAGMIRLNVVAQLQDLVVKMTESDRSVAEARIKGFEGQMLMKPHKTTLRCRLNDLSIDDSRDGAVYPHIIVIEDEKVFDLKFVMYNKSTSAPKSKKSDQLEHPLDFNVRVRIGQIQAVLLYKFFWDITRFIEPFINPDITESAKLAARAAVHKQVSTIQAENKRIQLNVDIRAPTVLIPQNSQSIDLFLVKLGDLNVRNAFEFEEVAADSRQEWEHFYLRLDSMQINRAQLSLSDDALHICQMVIEPLSLKADVKKAMKPRVSDAMLDIAGHLDLVKVNLLQKDLQLLFGIINENFTEGAPTSAPGGMVESTAEVRSQRASTSSTTPLADVKDIVIHAEPSVSFNVDVSMQGAVVMLYEEDQSNKTFDTDPTPKTALSRFELTKVDASVSRHIDGSAEAKVVLWALSLEDVRPDSDLAVKRIFQRIQLAKNAVDGNTPIIDFSYKRTSEEIHTIEFNVQKFRINVHIPYIRLLVAYANVATQQTYPDFSPMTSDSAVTKSAEDGDNMDSDHSLMLYGKVIEPEIVLFTDPSSPNSPVFVVKADFDVEYGMHTVAHHLAAKINNLSIVTCIYGSPNKTTSTILRPCNLEFGRVFLPNRNKLEMSATLSRCNVHVSVLVIRLVMDVISALNTGTDVTTQSEASTSDHNIVSDLWDVTAISPKKWLSTRSETKDLGVIATVVPTYTEVFKVDVAEVNVYFELQTMDSSVPLLCLNTSLEGEVLDWSKQLQVEAELHLEVSYFNEKLSVWEPLIEPIMEKENVYRPWEVLIKMVKAKGHPINCIYDETCFDQADGPVSDLHQQMHRSRPKSSSSETESDNETESTIIQPTLLKKPRNLSDHSRDSLSHHGSIQGESDSEPEGFINTLTNKLGSIFSSDSSDAADLSETDNDDAFESDKPVFITSQGPVRLHGGRPRCCCCWCCCCCHPWSRDADTSVDSVDTPIVADDIGENPCSYVCIHSRDQLKLNVTTQGISIITDLVKAISQPESSTFSLAYDKPAFEIHNKVGLHSYITLHPDIKYRKEQIHDATILHPGDVRPSHSDDDIISSVNGEDETDAPQPEDGLGFLAKSLADAGHALITAGAFVFDDDDDYLSGDALNKDRLKLEITGFHDIPRILHRQVCHRLLTLTTTKESDNIMELENAAKYSVVFDVAVRHGRKVISLQSPLQIENNLSVPIEIHCKNDDVKKYPGHNMDDADTDNKFVTLTKLDAGQRYSVPLLLAYNCQLFVTIKGHGCVAYSAIWWQDLVTAKERSKNIMCSSPQDENKFFIKAILTDGETLRPAQNIAKSIPYYTIILKPPVILHNYLPYDIQFSLEGSNSVTSLTHGDNTPLYSIDVQSSHRIKIQLLDYLGVDWSGSVEISQDMDEFKAITMDTEVDMETNATYRHLSLNIHADTKQSLELHVYSPYWVINKTDIPIRMRGSKSDNVFDCPASGNPLLFRYKRSKRKKSKLKVLDSRWSHSFSMDTVGTSGVVMCHDKERNRKYQFLLQIQLSRLQLTKIVTITPYFLVVNQSSHSLRYMEENEEADLWYDLEPTKCMPFWPTTESFNMYVKYENSSISSQHFPITRPHRTVLRMENGTALCAEVAGGTESPVTVTFSDYQPGDAPVRVDNLCSDVFIKIHQKNQSQVTLLSPNQSILYTWDDPTSERTLLWNVYGRKKADFPIFITKDGFGEIKLTIHTVKSSGVMSDIVDEHADDAASSTEDNSEDPDDDLDNQRLAAATRTDKVVIHWISLLEGQQRILLFTQDERVSKQARLRNQAENATLAVFASLEGAVLSVINDHSEEVALASLSSAPSLWEVEVNNKWKILSSELATWLEDKWTNDHDQASLQDHIEADLVNMTMRKPFMGALRRTYFPGLWLQYRASNHHMAIHGKFQRLQIDNQLRDAHFPTVFYPSPTPHYIAKRTGFKSFIEFGLVRRTVPENNIDTIRYMKLLIQEFNIRLDKGFLLSVIDVFANLRTKETARSQLQSDIRLAQRQLSEVASILAASKPHRLYYEYLHLSPLKMRISLSLSGQAHLVSESEQTFKSDVIDFFLNSVGVTFTEIKEVELKLAFFELKGVMLSMDSLLAQIRSHYTSQAIQNAYVFILGLDVLGNPYGLVKDFTQGLGDFFYEPFLGSIEGGDEFAEGLRRGIQSLLGNTVGATAGSIALITGSLGRALASLSFDSNYKKKRKLRFQQQPRNIPESLILAAKSFLLGVSLGLSGVVVKPYQGAKEEGIEGFFKGVGKGIMGLLTKPAGGIVDTVSMAFDGLRRAVEMDEGVVARMRPPRFINPFLGIRPYSHYQAIGYRLLTTIKKGQYAKVDTYWAHAPLSKDGRADVILITDRHIIQLEKCRLWGDWDIEWEIKVENMLGIPAITNGKLIFKVNPDDSQLNLFSADEQEISSPNEEILVWIQRKLEQLHTYREISNI